MATTEEILSGLWSEVATSIQVITPNRKISTAESTFEQHNASGVDKTIFEMQGRNRLFEIHNLQEAGPTSIGHSTEGRLFTADVTFLYSRQLRWQLAAMDDIKEIRHWFLNNHGGSGVAGVSSRYFPPELQTLKENASDDKWDYYTITLHIWSEITFN